MLRSTGLWVSTLAIAAFLLGFSLAHAASTIWSTTFTGGCWSCQQDVPTGVWGSAINGQVQVEYLAEIERLTADGSPTGILILPGDSIPVGTKMKLKFVPHHYTHISWFATGSAWDSPYGCWKEEGFRLGGNSAYGESGVCTGELITVSISVDQSFLYGSLVFAVVVDPPSKSVQGYQSHLSCQSAGGGDLNCTATNPGEVEPQFVFSQTPWSGYESGAPGGGQSVGGFVPERTIPYPITITDVAPSATPDPECTGDCVPGSPSKPTVSPVVVSGSAQCTVGIGYSISITASDPDGDDIKYGVDWDANGTVDQFAPATGYVPSGTSQTVSRTYATEGSKTVKVMAIDDNGLTSSWTTLTFSCTDEGSEAQGAGENLGDDEDTGGGGDSGATPNLTIRAIPSLVRSGETTKLHWSASNVTACTVTGENGDSFEGTISDEPTGNETSPITAQTTYTLSCEDDDGNTLTQSTTVNILPVWSEF
ncbi:PKD domain-containing protein [Candidatus Kaiserbacteria bacterium]|nr:PKD domain-containing protein [Candidatus Kaiserbacteria bacterium]